ncbi:MAG TPA: hypothetical protein PLP17_03215 [Oligoflexia bacterium]|nr:hypothetical protein [Oligoflexia bacterium]
MHSISKQDNNPGVELISGVLKVAAYRLLSYPRLSGASAALAFAAQVGTQAQVAAAEQGAQEPPALGAPAVEAAQARRVIEQLSAAVDEVLKDPKLPGAVKAADPRTFAEEFERLRRMQPGDAQCAAEIIERSGLPQSRVKTRSALLPEDPKRPGLLISFSDADKDAVDQTVGELRGATTSALIWSGGLRELKSTRANSTLIIRVPEVLKAELTAVQERLKTAAEYSTLKALASGPEGRENVLREFRDISAKILELSGQKLKLYACGKAAEFKRKGEDDGMPVHLLAVETDFENKRVTGIEYYVITGEGKIYSMPHIGKNFDETKGSFVPAKPYAEFNVALLRIYQKNGSLSRDDLYQTALANGFCPTEDGKITYLNLGRGQLRETKAKLQSVYDAKGSIAAADLEAALP